MTLAFLCNGYTIKYVPIDYYKRVGRSKFHPVNDTYNYLLTVIRMVMYFNPLKVFLPTSLVLLLWGLAKTIYDNTVYRDIRESDVTIIVISIVIGMMGLLADLIVVQHRRQ
jgi:hypothetical protein